MISSKSQLCIDGTVIHNKEQYQVYKLVIDNDKFGIYQLQSNQIPPVSVIITHDGYESVIIPVSPINSKYEIDGMYQDTSISGINILHNISGLIDTNSANTVIFKLTSQIGQAIDEVHLSKDYYQVQKKPNIGNYVYRKPAIDEYTFQVDIDWLNGMQLLHQNSNYQVPFASLKLLTKADCIPAGKLYGWYGGIAEYEPLYYVAQLEEGNLYMNIFGLYTGYTYKLIHIQSNVVQFYGLEYNAGNVFQMYETSEPHSTVYLSNSQKQLSTYFKVINLQNNSDIVYNVMYEQSDPYGIKYFNGLVYLLDGDKTIVLELINTYALQIEDTITTSFPFKYVSTSLESQLYTDIDSFETKVHTYSVATPQTIRMTLLDVDLKPTIYDSISYVFGIDREDESGLQQTLKNVYYLFRNGYEILSQQNKIGFDGLMPKVVRIKMYGSNEEQDLNEPNRIQINITREQLEEAVINIVPVLYKPANYDSDNTITGSLTFNPVLSVAQVFGIPDMNQLDDKFVEINTKTQTFEGLFNFTSPSIKQGQIAFVAYVNPGPQVYYNNKVYVPSTQQITIRGYYN